MMDLPKPACIHGSRSKTCERCDLERQLAAVTAELAAARGDAERYRWLIADDYRMEDMREVAGMYVTVDEWAAAVSAHIDAARSAEQQHTEEKEG